ncbi:MAG: peptidoglycan DD-metalloendopeptidase family protein [Candidatus Endonucleobacter bathymodioli]|uniref:Peptidoglycan DD-metalloendopeptidase family protein n=1 Tax=Candidatus Endonucleibacter bathymodioli TaxID=539814 RepID=A0AA90STE5_9GAMM|nr:peptidoglycan DD-metalloendopeptidase family protein [Candidatus Endonucleobacter bathymodioli]
MEKYLLQAEQNMMTLKRDISAIEKEIKAGKQAIGRLQVRKKKLDKQQEEGKRQVMKSLRSIYLTSGDDQLKLLLNQENPEDISQQLVYLEFLQKAQIKAIKNFEVIIEDLKQNRQQQSAINQALITKRDILKQKGTMRTRQKSQRQQLLIQLLSQYKKGGKQLDSLEDQREELETILASVKSHDINSKVPFSKMKGLLPWPTEGIVQSSYNQRRNDTQMRWQGILMAASKGLEVKAVHDGRVIFANWLRGYGQLMIIDHGQEYLTLYAHNQSLLKKEGDIALAGEPVALVGKTGGQSSPVLYFEIRLQGHPLDPAIWLGKPNFL